MRAALFSVFRFQSIDLAFQYLADKGGPSLPTDRLVYALTKTFRQTDVG